MWTSTISVITKGHIRFTFGGNSARKTYNFESSFKSVTFCAVNQHSSSTFWMRFSRSIVLLKTFLSNVILRIFALQQSFPFIYSEIQMAGMSKLSFQLPWRQKSESSNWIFSSRVPNCYHSKWIRIKCNKINTRISQNYEVIFVA